MWKSIAVKKSIAFRTEARGNKDDEAAGTVLPRRNAGVLGSERAGLIIDPGPQTIAGENAAAVPLDGAFQGTLVNLGELRTDAAGRLLFLGGRRVSASPTGQPIDDATDPNAFINANGWYDDTSDGPLTASVRIQGREIPVDPAWVLTAPPNYGPGTFGVRTLYDLLLDVFADVGWIGKPPSRPSFRHDVYPTLQRALYTDLRGAENVNATLNGEHSSAHQLYGDRLQAIRTAYLRHRTLAYADERRWPDSEFWARRHTCATLP